MSFSNPARSAWREVGAVALYSKEENSYAGWLGKPTTEAFTVFYMGMGREGHENKWHSFHTGKERK